MAMRPETKELIRQKTYRKLEDGSMQLDDQGGWINARDIRSILNCEFELLQKTLDKRKHQMGLMEILEINRSGYAGVLPNGEIVDRRKHSEAIPIEKNTLLGIPEPKALNGN